MSLPIRLLPEAKAEFDAGLGVDFVGRIRVVLERIALNPRLHAMVYGDVRKAVVTRFPYIVLYREESGELVVISVFHSSRDPSTWQARV